MSNTAQMMTVSLSELIAKEVEKTLDRLRAKIFEAAEIEDDIEIDLSKFAQNTAKKIISSETFTEMVTQITSAVEKVADKPKQKDEKEKKEKKDPQAPKGAKNAFIFFCNENRTQVKTDNSALKATEITKKLAEMWKEVDAEDKERYQKMADGDKKRYADDISAYEPKEGFKNPKSPKKSKAAKSTAPKRALSAYIFFCQAKREEVKEANPELKSSEVMSELGKLWKALSDKKKKPFEKLAEEDKKRYAEEMKEYVPTEEEKEAKEAKSKGKGKGKKVKEASKRSPSAYLLFCKENRDKVKEKNEGKKMTEITTILGKMWTDLSDKKKKSYMEKALKLKEEFESEKNKVESSSVEEDVEEDNDKSSEEDEDDEPILDDEEEEEEIKPVSKKNSNSKK